MHPALALFVLGAVVLPCALASPLAASNLSADYSNAVTPFSLDNPAPVFRWTPGMCAHIATVHEPIFERVLLSSASTDRNQTQTAFQVLVSTSSNVAACEAAGSCLWDSGKVGACVLIGPCLHLVG